MPDGWAVGGVEQMERRRLAGALKLERRRLAGALDVSRAANPRRLLPCDRFLFDTGEPELRREGHGPP